MIELARGGRAITADAINRLPCADIRSLFFAVGAMKRQANANALAARSATNGGKTGDNKPANQIPTLAEMNKRNREAWG